MAIRGVTIDWMCGHISDILKDVYGFSKKNDVDCTFKFNGVEVVMERGYVYNPEDAIKITDAVQKQINKVYL